MEMQSIYLIFYILNTITCFVAGGLILLLKPLLQASNRKYKIASRTLAIAAFIAGTGHFFTVLFDDSFTVTMGMFAFPVILISVSQFLPLTFLFILLFRETYVTGKTIMFHAGPFIIMTVLYLVGYFIWDDPVVHTWGEWWENLPNSLLFIRTLFGLFYLAQLVVFTYIFFRERIFYLRGPDRPIHKYERFELRWITYSFLSALAIGILAFSLCFTLSKAYEAVVTSVFSVYYLIIAVCFVYNYYTHKTLRSGLFRENDAEISAGTDTETETAVAGPEQVQSMENDLFIRVTELMEKDRIFIDPSVNRAKLARMLFTNECYLASAIHEETGLSIQSYITRQRLTYACSLLLIPDDPRSIEDIAFDSGFSSLRSFNRIFREAMELTPSELRKSNQITPTLTMNSLFRNLAGLYEI